ncbi:MAG TPA: DUF2726 domain-containing protein [Nitrospira sp.]|jgi:Protein of unknown function (DUF2726)|nr:DUF2726 domain-containing protein [Nitrospira sp.]
MTGHALDSWFLIILVVVPALLLWRIFSGRSATGLRSGPFVLPLGAVLRPQPLLGEKELLLYNLIRLAVQDRYLVFAQVPLLSFLAVEAEGDARLDVLRHLALKRADVALVHPGSRVVEQVVQLEDEPSTVDAAARPGRDVQRILQASGIRVTTLNTQPTYTVHELERLLGISDLQ